MLNSKFCFFITEQILESAMNFYRMSVLMQATPKRVRIRIKYSATVAFS